MPPRYAYWTILIDDKPTAFRAREREELQPTFAQLQRKNSNVTMQWFARGKLWASREAERDDFQTQKHAASAPRERKADRPEGAPEKRGSAWRPGGKHVDPRDRFKKKNRPERAWSEKDPATQRDRDKPGYVAKPRPEWRDKPAGAPRGDRPWQDKKSGRPGPFGPGEKRPWSGKPRERKPWDNKPAASAPPSDRPWQTKPTGPRAQRKPWVGKPTGDGRRPGPSGPGEKRPWSGKPPDRSGPPRERKPWQDKPAGGPPRGDRPWSSKPPASGGDGRRPGPSGPGEKRPWSGKPRDPNRKPFAPRGPRPGGPPSERPPRKRRDDED